MQIALGIHHLSNLFSNRLSILSKILDYLNYLLFNCSIPGSVEIGKGTKLSKGGIAIVIHERAKIGKNCVIGTCIVIGGRSRVFNVRRFMG